MSQLPRDIFIETLYEAASNDRDIYFLDADLGAAALDRFRADLPDQFVHVGISEQNMIDVAAGLALEGKKVYTYAMAPFVSLRCYEQIKVALASMRLPVTVIGVGAGYSYAPAGPTHYATEDLSCMRALGGIEILNPTDSASARYAARLTVEKPGLRYIRLDRQALREVYSDGDDLDAGWMTVAPGEDLVIVAMGIMLQQALEVRERIQRKTGREVAVIDAFRVKPVEASLLRDLGSRYRRVVSYEEHFLSGGLGSILTESLADAGCPVPVRRIGIQDRYFLENGDRVYLQALAGIDVDSAERIVLNELERL